VFMTKLLWVTHSRSLNEGRTAGGDKSPTQHIQLNFGGLYNGVVVKYWFEKIQSEMSNSLDKTTHT
jgi:hypothetical protein